MSSGARPKQTKQDNRRQESSSAVVDMGGGGKSPERPVPDDGGADDPAAGAKKLAIKKVPGEVAPVGRLGHEARALATKLRRMPLPALRDALARQDGILGNAALCRALPDRGMKIREKRDQIEAMVREKTRAADEAAEMLAGLTLGAGARTKVESLEEMEFRMGGGLSAHLDRPAGARVRLDSDDDDDDNGNEEEVEPDSRASLKIHAQKEVPPRTKTGPGTACRDVPDPSSLADAHSKLLSDRAEAAEASGRGRRFALFSSARSETVEAGSAAEKAVSVRRREKKRIEGDKVELMPLPPEPASKDGSKMLTVEESLRIQREQADRIKAINLQKALDRLSSARASGDPQPFPESVAGDMRYRDSGASASAAGAGGDDGGDASDAEEEEDEAGNEEEEEGDRGINFTFSGHREA